MFRLAVFEGLRPGEILGLRLGDVFETHIEIVLRVYKGTFDTPKGRKGKRTARKAALSPGTATELAFWRTCLLNRSGGLSVPLGAEYGSVPRQRLVSGSQAKAGGGRPGMGDVPGPAPDKRELGPES